ncbi:hypothetical protein [Streptomyces sp. SP17KL33]|uniref:hypothetical protein n=1 Tax=Streptomyces sp. SP17KL33 TaxID=3002534 RepID=UPI002E7784E3|nr:hypothetical protein [Streptomyces sp. SP17KL33]MEE1830934.1 hypothetical protein [Streptomyces sp. SP17KL33]
MATTKGLRRGRTSTEVPTRVRLVAAHQPAHGHQRFEDPSVHRAVLVGRQDVVGESCRVVAEGLGLPCQVGESSRVGARGLVRDNDL